MKECSGWNEGVGGDIFDETNGCGDYNKGLLMRQTVVVTTTKFFDETNGCGDCNKGLATTKVRQQQRTGNSVRSVANLYNNGYAQILSISGPFDVAALLGCMLRKDGDMSLFSGHGGQRGAVENVINMAKRLPKVGVESKIRWGWRGVE